jgi:hypothetical protein
LDWLMVAVRADVEHRRRGVALARVGARLRGHVLAQRLQCPGAGADAGLDARPGALWQTIREGDRAFWVSAVSWAVMYTAFMMALT